MATALVGAVIATAVSTVTSAAADADAPPCAAQMQRAADVKRQIDAHNAQPHVFVLPSQQAQYNAYNVRAQQLNSARDAARAAFLACANAMTELGAGRDISRPNQEQLDRLRNAAGQIPPGYRVPPPPPLPAGRIVSAPRELDALYRELRRNNPPKNYSGSLQNTSRPRVGDPDPAFPPGSGVKIGRKTNGDPMVSPDHIVPLARLVYLPGFTRLSPESMYYVSRAPANLQWLSRRANSAKNSDSSARVQGADPAWVKSQRQLEDQVQQKLTDLISRLLRSEGKTP
ncbi:hypothetical protein GOARA_021_00930 [Gordonia araii NBRC 100433]|uniref:Lipoprotein n=1 Tax=Gordonia araii NBRC 100433 TaxID=1073574 RepID=G7GZ31_9ACTN|nr:hypothetical protein [Gordonia araii]NNG97064.1 hypothetical protein [Gordonia araii NBRC 100433]GAB08856.1 hypothetical protein GOARA_021_00930 [Gordonia araii NBRC 100433]